MGFIMCRNAVGAAFGKSNEKKNKYQKLLDKSNHLAEEISEEAGNFMSESGK